MPNGADFHLNLAFFFKKNIKANGQARNDNWNPERIRDIAIANLREHEIKKPVLRTGICSTPQQTGKLRGACHIVKVVRALLPPSVVQRVPPTATRRARRGPYPTAPCGRRRGPPPSSLSQSGASAPPCRCVRHPVYPKGARWWCFSPVVAFRLFSRWVSSSCFASLSSALLASAVRVSAAQSLPFSCLLFCSRSMLFIAARRCLSLAPPGFHHQFAPSVRRLRSLAAAAVMGLSLAGRLLSSGRSPGRHRRCSASGRGSVVRQGFCRQRRFRPAGAAGVPVRGLRPRSLRGLGFRFWLGFRPGLCRQRRGGSGSRSGACGCCGRRFSHPCSRLVRLPGSFLGPGRACLCSTKAEQQIDRNIKF